MNYNTARLRIIVFRKIRQFLLRLLTRIHRRAKDKKASKHIFWAVVCAVDRRLFERCQQDGLLGSLCVYLQPSFPVYKRIIELNLTNRCNLKCINCASSCGHAFDESFMTSDQIELFVEESFRANWEWDQIKLYGGEPTLNPYIESIMAILKLYKDRFPQTKIYLLTNGTGEKVQQVLSVLPDWIHITNTAKGVARNSHFRFESYNWAPVDTKRYRKADFTRGCFRIQECGICLSSNGYYVCAPGAHVDRVFGFNIGYRKLEDVLSSSFRDQLPLLCKHCGLYKFPKHFTCKEIISPIWQCAYDQYKISKPKRWIYGSD